MNESSKKIKLVDDFIKKRREEMGISQRALGLAFDPAVTTQFISNVERGVTPLPPTHIPVLAKALNIAESELMVLLEKEYSLKLNGRLGKDSGLNGDHDFDFIKKLYEAYRVADSKTRQSFAETCASLFQVTQSTDPDAGFDS